MWRSHTSRSSSISSTKCGACWQADSVCWVLENADARAESSASVRCARRPAVSDDEIGHAPRRMTPQRPYAHRCAARVHFNGQGLLLSKAMVQDAIAGGQAKRNARIEV